MEASKPLGQAIRQHRRARHLSAVQLSQRAGLSDGYVAMLESGRNRRPGIQVVAQIAAVLDISLDDLVRDMGLPTATSTASFSRVTEIWQRLHAPARKSYLDMGETLAELQTVYEDVPPQVSRDLRRHLRPLDTVVLEEPESMAASSLDESVVDEDAGDGI